MSSFLHAASKGTSMEPTQNETEATTDLVTESLVEEVSIDGMCGVY
jgi:mycofactocin precursor